MSYSKQLRKQREGTALNLESSKQEKILCEALESVRSKLLEKFPKIRIEKQAEININEIISFLKKSFPDVKFAEPKTDSTMRPTGGILYLVDKDENKYPFLITEKKRQGTNNERLREGKKRQAQGNAIERLGKNVIGLRAALLNETIFPFVCFGDGCDFAPESSIIDRVITIAMYGEINKEHLHNEGVSRLFNRGTFYFREKEWSRDEMEKLSYSIALKSVYYYFSKYGENRFFIN